MDLRKTLWLGSTLFVLVVGGCGAVTKTGVVGAGDAAGKRVTVPPGLPASVLEAREGALLERAELPLERVLADLPALEYLGKAEVGGSGITGVAESQPAMDGGASGEVLLESQRVYVAGRTAWLKGQNYEAIRLLTEALLDCPNEPAILRLLGHIYYASGNRVRGAVFLKQAVLKGPADMYSLYLLGRSEFEQGNWDGAIAALGRAVGLEKRGIDPGMLPLIHHFLGSALEQRGYDAAAVGEYLAYLDSPSFFNRTSRFVRDLGALYRRRGQSYRMVGDALNRLGRSEEAMRVYLKASELIEDDDRAGLVLRMVYTRVRLGHLDAAREIAVGMLRDSGGDPEVLPLVGYLVQEGVPAERLSGEVKAVYEKVGRPSHLAIALSDLLGGEGGREFLKEHLEARPTDWDAYERLLKGYLSLGSQAGRAEAIRVAAGAVRRLPRAAGNYAGILLKTAGEPKVVLEAVNSLGAGEGTDAAMSLITGMALVAAERGEEATGWFEKAISADGALEEARLQLIALLLKKGETGRVEELMRPLEGRQDARVVGLRVQTLERLGRVEDAKRMLEEQVLRQPDNLELLLTRAVFLLKVGDVEDLAGVERSLWDALNAHPGAEALYETLFDLYDTDRLPDSGRRRVRLLERVQGALPQSRISRLQTAAQRIRQNEMAEAETLLRSLLREDSGDYRAMDWLLVLLFRVGRAGEAQAMIDQRLTSSTTNRELLAAAQRYYAMTKQSRRFYEVTERLVVQEPVGLERSRKLAVVYLRLHRHQEAVDAISRALFGERGSAGGDAASDYDVLGRALIGAGRGGEVDGYFEKAVAGLAGSEEAMRVKFIWAMMTVRMGQRERSEKILQEILAEAPDDANANNALGYSWAERGERLEEAKGLIQKALDVDPESAAYLDSMGWVCYKLGRFEEAAEWLGKARSQPGGFHPTILDHLADALYRVGRIEEARKYWKAALEGITPEMLEEEQEVREMEPKLKGKLEKIENVEKPATAEVVGVAEPATVPAGLGQ